MVVPEHAAAAARWSISSCGMKRRIFALFENDEMLSKIILEERAAVRAATSGVC